MYPTVPNPAARPIGRSAWNSPPTRPTQPPSRPAQPATRPAQPAISRPETSRTVGVLTQLALLGPLLSGAALLIFDGVPSLGPIARSAGPLAVTLGLLLFGQLRDLGATVGSVAGSQIRSTLIRSRARGNRPDYPVRDLLRASIAVTVLAGALGWLGCLALARLSGRLLADWPAGELAAHLLVALAPALPPSLCLHGLLRYFAAMGRPALGIGPAVRCAGASLGLGWLFGVGVGPLPGFGIAGVGTAVALGYLLGCWSAYRAARRDPVLAPTLSVAGWRASWLAVRRLLRLSAPIAGRRLLGPPVTLLLALALFPGPLSGVPGPPPGWLGLLLGAATPWLAARFRTWSRAERGFAKGDRPLVQDA
jgi:hypothetical protein